MVPRRRSLTVALVTVLLAGACAGGGMAEPQLTEVAPSPAIADADTEDVPTAPIVTVTKTVVPPATAVPGGVAARACTPDLTGFSFIFVTSPAPGARVKSPLVGEGCANVFEGNVEWRLRSDQGATIAEGFTTATCGTGCVGDFRFEVAFSTSERQIATLEVFSTSAEDGSIEHLNAVPLLLEP